jgi:hypothetical protein
MSKRLVIALLVINVALVAWQYNRHVENMTRTAMTTKPIPDGAPSLTMLREMDALPAPKTPEPQPDPAPEGYVERHEHVPASQHCLEIGPFIDVTSRDLFRDWIRDYIAALTVRAETVRKRQLFWVYLEPSSDALAKRNLDDLIERDVTDYLLIRRGNLKNAISLGLFSSQDSVNRRLAELSEKGYTPVVVPRFETTDHFWIAAQLAKDYADGLDLPAPLLGDARAKDIGCESI